MTILILLVKPDEELGRASCWGSWLEEENCINKSVVKERIHENAFGLHFSFTQ